MSGKLAASQKPRQTAYRGRGRVSRREVGINPCPKAKPRGRPWLPGQSGNPAGRPKSQDCLAAAVRMIADMDMAAGDLAAVGGRPEFKMTYAQGLACVLWHNAVRGNLKAARMIAEKLTPRDYATPPQGSVLLAVRVASADGKAEAAALTSGRVQLAAVPLSLPLDIGQGSPGEPRQAPTPEAIQESKRRRENRKRVRSAGRP